jgi:ATP-dependent protease HslVU (ClpYQ) peptidase subunit
MTCIVAIERNGKAYLGSDSFMGDGYLRDRTDKPKFFIKGERFAIAFAGSFRGAQLIEHKLKVRKRKTNENEEAYLVNEVVTKLQKLFAAGGINITTEGQADSIDTDFIVCLNGKIFEIQSDYSVIKSKNKFTAIGAGRDFALGALKALDHNTSEAEVLLKRSLEVACELSPQVCAPLHQIVV